MAFEDMETIDNVQKFLRILRSQTLQRCQHQDTMIDLLTPEVIRELAAHPQQWVSLRLIPSRLNANYIWKFAQMVYALHAELPQQEVLKVWCCDEFRYFSPFIFDQDPPVKCVVSPFLIDYPYVRQAICRQKKTGWRFLRYCGNHRLARTPVLPEAWKNAVCEDSPEAFAICQEMMSYPLTYSFLVMVLKHRAHRIFRSLLTGHLLTKIIPLPELCVLLTANYPEEQAIELLQMVEEYRPGTLKNFRDPFGRNLLWYTVENPHLIWFFQDAPLVNFLLEHGCDAGNCNTVGLPWRCTVEELPLPDRKRLWTHYSQETRSRYSLPELSARHEQLAAAKFLRQWPEASVPGYDMSVNAVQKQTRPGSGQPLFPEVRKKLANRLIEAFWGYRLSNDRTLPEVWKNHAVAPGISSSGGQIPLLTPADYRELESFHYFDPVHRDAAGKPVVTSSGSQNAAVAILNTGLLVYHPYVRTCYCRQQAPGWQILRHYGGDASERGDYLNRKEFCTLLANDDVPEFALLYGMTECNCPLAMLEDIFQHNAIKVFDWLLCEREEFIDHYTPEELLFYLVARRPEIQAVELLNGLDKRWPGLIHKTKDFFGSNLLWYALANRHVKRNFDQSIILSFLRSKNCFQTQCNMFGLCPQDILETAAVPRVAKLLKKAEKEPAV